MSSFQVVIEDYYSNSNAYYDYSGFQVTYKVDESKHPFDVEEAKKEPIN